MPIRRILHVEDNPGDANLLREALEEAGADVSIDVATNGVHGIEYLHQYEHLPDLIVLDINMPVMNGFTLLRLIGRHADWSRVPVVMLTSSQRPAEYAEAMELGAAGYLVKPPEYDGYVDLARRLLRFPHIEPTPVIGTAHAPAM
jgi:CheY-like chemotaxis protein